MSRDRPSEADFDLAALVGKETQLDISAAQIRRWANAGLIPYTPGQRGPGRGRSYPPEALASAVEAAQLIVNQGFNIAETTLVLFSRRRPTPEARVRAAYRSLYDRASAVAEAAANPLLDDIGSHSTGSRWVRSYARTPRGQSWRSRLRGAVADWNDNGEPATRLGRKDRPRTLHPTRGLRSTLTALVMLLTGDKPSSEARQLLLQAAGLSDLSADDVADATPTIGELTDIIDESPLDTILTAIDWAHSVDVIIELVAEAADMPDMSGTAADLKHTDELEIALSAPAIVAQWQPSYEPPDDIRQRIAIATLVRAAGPDLLPYLQAGPGCLEQLDAEERSEVEQGLKRLADDYPEEVSTLFDLDN